MYTLCTYTLYIYIYFFFPSSPMTYSLHTNNWGSSSCLFFFFNNYLLISVICENPGFGENSIFLRMDNILLITNSLKSYFPVFPNIILLFFSPPFCLAPTGKSLSFQPEILVWCPWCFMVVLFSSSFCILSLIVLSNLIATSTIYKLFNYSKFKYFKSWPLFWAGEENQSWTVFKVVKPDFIQELL